MRKFILHLLLFGVLMICAAEIFLQLSGLASDVMDRELTEDQILVFQPDKSGYRTRGMRAEINAHYHINAQGWNSTLDYDQVDSTSIAIVGDSYIAGFWNDVDSTVAACLQQLISEVNTGVEVHSYGHPGANFYDYENLTPILRDKGYRYIYIYMGAKDFNGKKPSFTGQTKPDVRTGIRYWYRKSALLRYLNVNFGIKEILASKKSKRKQHHQAVEEGKTRALARLNAFSDKTVVFFYEDDFFDEVNIFQPLLKISHVLQPIDHGFNKHWNVNGNKNAATTIFQHWLNNQN